jgi:hypothetical protein
LECDPIANIKPDGVVFGCELQVAALAVINTTQPLYARAITLAVIDKVFLFELVKGFKVAGKAFALIEHIAIPVQAVCVELLQYSRAGA